MSVVSLVLVFCGTGLAQSAKNAVQVNSAAIVNATCGSGWSNIANVSIKTSQQKDLVLGASLETNLFTRTLVKSKGGTSDTSTAEAELRVRAVVDAAEARPGVVVFDRRLQSLMAKFNGICTDQNADNIVNYDECTTPEELELILDTSAAHHFNFILEDVGVGTHDVWMQGCIQTATTTQTGEATAGATAGKGSLTVEEVRLVRGQDVTF
ncbi:MAG: hypothetical protein A3H27_04970 [Acidobacteria bacterium RIFCSPLOWO2_02_FULL_59_13]|nr:MAG: hypothetical protein A3H27_04970 [Acidobacteria bacterium RIFCSPLOWO2_02_FULL_59_13]